MAINLWPGSMANATLAALGKSFAVIEFKPDGEVLDANDLFCEAIGYARPEIVGRQHRLFVETAHAATRDYDRFWSDLRDGQFKSGEYKRLRKDGSPLWIRASYAPVIDASGKLVKVVKLALDITREKLTSAKNESLLRAIDRSQAIIRFSLDGVILEVNDNFLATIGYTRAEVIGRHHSLFAEPAYAASSEYEGFWRRLRAGDFFSDEFRRLGKGGREVWMQAQYNPIFDIDGQVVEVVKIASDLTERMRQVHLVGQALRRLSQGDLTARISESLMPSLDSLRASFNSSADGLAGALARVAESSAAVSGGSDEIASSADGLARRSEQQAASLEQTAAAVEEINATVARTASGAKHADAVVRRASQQAERSGAVMKDAVAAMSSIEQSSTQIGQIIGVIDEIAFQTNLLALNAGVEAARAGDAGRGFAVVAQEVRALAQRTADAAKQIKGLIVTSAQHVGRGAAMVDDAGVALEEILAQVSEIKGLVGDIALSAQEQATGLGQVAVAVGEMDRMLQSNAGLVEEAHAASHLLKEQANVLGRLIDQFQLPDLAISAAQRAA